MPMSGTWMSFTRDIGRPLPPEIEFNPTTGTFSGLAAPGLCVEVIVNGEQGFSAGAAPDGRWTIALDGPPRWYSVFEIGASRPATGEASERIRLVFGGSAPTLDDIHASRTSAFGRADTVAEIVAYGPSGQVLGRCFAFGKHGLWNIAFREPLRLGDRICFVAKCLNGSTSMPMFTAAEAFSVDMRDVGHVDGSGAEPGDRIQFLDIENGTVLTETDASETGVWSASFSRPLAAGKRIGIRRFHADGAVSEGSTVSVAAGSRLMPAIDGVSRSQAWGTAVPGQWVAVDQYRNGALYRRDVDFTQAGPNGMWIKDLSGPAQPGDLFVGKTMTGPDAGARSMFYNACPYNDSRHSPPLVAHIDSFTAYGYASANQFVVISTRSSGELLAVAVRDDGYWSTPDRWSAYGVSDPANELFLFETAETVSNATFGPTSNRCARLGSAQAAIPDKPVIQQYNGSFFSGAELTIPSSVKVFDKSHNGGTISVEPMQVCDDGWDSGQVDLFNLNNGQQPPIPLGDEIYAIATYGSDDQDPGSTSDPSDIATVGMQPGMTRRPIPPEITSLSPPAVTGRSQPNTTVFPYIIIGHVIEPFSPQFTSDGNWEIKFQGDQVAGAIFAATASFSSAAFVSDQFVKGQTDVDKDMPIILTVATDCVTLQVANPEKEILGWRESDGARIVQYRPTPSTQGRLSLSYLNSATLGPGERLFITAVSPQDGTMTPYDTQAEGYFASD